MKKLQIAVLVMSMAAASVFADRPIPPDSLPQNIKDMVSSHFQGRTIQYAEGDRDSFEITLSDQTRIELGISGDWEDIRSMSGVPASLLPSSAIDFIGKNYPNIPIIKAEKDREGLEIQLADRTDIDFTPDGQWTRIASMTGVSPALLPAAVSDYLSKNYSGIAIQRVNKDWNNLTVRLTNRMLLFFDQNGTLVGQRQGH